MSARITVDATGQICSWSLKAEELLGYSASEAVGQSVEMIIPHDLKRRHSAGFARFVQTGISTLPEVTTTIALHKTGKLMKLLVSVEASLGDRHRQETQQMRRVKFTILATVALGFALATSTAMAQTTTFHDRAGRITGKARTGANGTTNFYDAAGSITGRARTDTNGTTTFYDAAGRVTGKASASKR